VTAHFADGREESGDVLIGADGLASTIRAQLLGPSEPRYAGITSWRAIFDFDPNHAEAPRGTIRLNWGRGAQFNYYRVGGGSLYWLALAREPQGGIDPEGRTKATVLDRFKDFYPTVHEIIDATPEDRIFRTDIVDRDPSAVWVDNRVALLGDAAHPMTPNMAQGAGQAIEDGIVMANCLREGDPAEGLRAYEERRKKRATMFVKGSRNSTRALALSNPIACAARNAAFRVVMGRIAPRQQQRWMSYDF
jgi:2-polyprenyl-6-methoxyphenol hydroxylase-like FAD-dependent oxidoreductase